MHCGLMLPVRILTDGPLHLYRDLVTNKFSAGSAAPGDEETVLVAHQDYIRLTAILQIKR